MELVPQVSMKFNSFDEVQTFISNYGNTVKIMYNCVRSTNISQLQLEEQVSLEILNKMAKARVTFECKFGTVRNSESTGLRGTK